MVDDVEAERVRLTRELFEVGHRLGMPTAAAQARRSARMAELQEQLRALPPPAPVEPTGMRAGAAVIIDGRLGTGFSRPDPVAEESSHHAHDYEPWAREYGDE